MFLITKLFKCRFILDIMSKNKIIISLIGFSLFLVFPLLGIYFETQNLIISSIVFFLLTFLIIIGALSILFAKEEVE